MAYESKPGDGVLFPTREKRSEKSPDMTGHVFAHRDMRKGDRIAISAWNKTSKAGTSFISLAASDPRIPKVQEQPAQPDEEIPF